MRKAEIPGHMCDLELKYTPGSVVGFDLCWNIGDVDVDHYLSRPFIVIT
jgi:hypothetical protein